MVRFGKQKEEVKTPESKIPEPETTNSPDIMEVEINLDLINRKLNTLIYYIQVIMKESDIKI